MMRIVERNKKWKLPVRREGGGQQHWEGYLSAENTKLEEWKWHGTSKLDGQEWSHLAKSDTVEYVVITDTWKFVEEQLTPEELGRDTTHEEYRDFSEHDYDNYDVDDVYWEHDDDEEEDITDEEGDEEASEYQEEGEEIEEHSGNGV
jgi:hypothetical protein